MGGLERGPEEKTRKCRKLVKDAVGKMVHSDQRTTTLWITSVVKCNISLKYKRNRYKYPPRSSWICNSLRVVRKVVNF